MSNLDRQTKQVLSLMKRDGAITRLTAQHYGIVCLTARIADLRTRHGYSVQCDLKRDAEGRRYGSWRIVPPTQVQQPLHA
jgi:hypothetical protein